MVTLVYWSPLVFITWKYLLTSHNLLLQHLLSGVDDGKLPMCRNIPKGHVISLTVIHDLGVGLDKVSS